MQALMSMLLGWLVLDADLPPTESAPPVELVSTLQMAEIRQQRLLSSRPSQAGFQAAPSQPPDSFQDLYAMYDEASGTIYLSQGWKADAPVDVSILVHELVHYLQHAGGIGYGCPEAREEPAYRAQERWLNLFDSSLAEAFEIDAMTLLLRTKCMH
jgi:hypothetical protein